jgi:restriction system protein
MIPPWQQYQIHARNFFRSLGFEAENDVILQGVRTKHAVDVLVKTCQGGMDITWIIECKNWHTSITQLHVLALREIVADLGADKGVLLSESGFQRGAIDASNFTNIQCTSLRELEEYSKGQLIDVQIRELYEDLANCRDIYWEIPKEIRIQHGLRSKVGELGFSGTMISMILDEVLSKALRRQYPIFIGGQSEMVRAGTQFPYNFESADEVVRAVKPVLEEFRKRLDSVEASIRSVNNS